MDSSNGTFNIYVENELWLEGLRNFDDVCASAISLWKLKNKNSKILIVKDSKGFLISSKEWFHVDNQGIVKEGK